MPVIARNIGGMPEAMDGAGVLYDGLDPLELAKSILRVLSDSALREDILLSQQKRMERLREQRVDTELKALMAGLLEGRVWLDPIRQSISTQTNVEKGMNIEHRMSK